MAEELRIVVVDQGGSAPSRGPTAPGGTRPGGVPSGPPRVPGGGQFPRVHVPPPVQPPTFVQPSPVQPSPGRSRDSDPSRFAISAIGTAGGVAGAAAAGNVAGAVSGASKAIVAAVTGPVGIAVAAVTVGFGVAVIAVKKFAQAIESETNKLAGFSAPLSLAQAQTEIRREEALMRRAQRIGPELAAAEQLRSKFEEAMTDIGTEILGVLLKMLESATPFIEVGIKVLTLFADFLEKWGDVIVKAMFVLARMRPVVVIMEAVFRILEQIFDAIVPDEDDGPDPFATQFMNLLPRNARGQTQFFQPRPGV